jgi:hypothetical protein
MCTNEFPLTAEWSYYLVERILSDVNDDVHFAWRFVDEQEALNALVKQSSEHPDRTYQIFKSID